MSNVETKLNPLRNLWGKVQGWLLKEFGGGIVAHFLPVAERVVLGKLANLKLPNGWTVTDDVQDDGSFYVTVMKNGKQVALLNVWPDALEDRTDLATVAGGLAHIFGGQDFGVRIHQRVMSPVIVTPHVHVDPPTPASVLPKTTAIGKGKK